MKINLVHREKSLGEIYPYNGSLITCEIKGLMIPNKYFIKVRNTINKYNEIFHPRNSRNFIDKTLDKLLQRKFNDLKLFYSDLALTLNDEKITNEKSQLRIIDNLVNTGLGNPILYIEAWKLETNRLNDELDLYDISFKYTSSPHPLLEITKEGNTKLEY